MSNLSESVPLARPGSPSHYPFLRREKKNNKISHEILEDYQNLNYFMNYDENHKRKKLIKIQDCTDWLAYEAKKNNTQYTKSSFNNSTNLFRHYSAFNQRTTNLPPQSTSLYFQQPSSEADPHLDTSQQQIYKINMLLNRKSARANT